MSGEDRPGSSSMTTREALMRRLVAIATLALGGALALSPTLSARVGSQSVPCTNGNYQGSVAGGHTVTFVVDCAAGVVNTVAFDFASVCGDGHTETGNAELSSNIPIKLKRGPKPKKKGARRETVYFFASNFPATKLIAQGVDNTATGKVFVRATTPPTGTVKGTLTVTYNVGSVTCYGKLGTGGKDPGGPANFTAQLMSTA